jgi:hypothetical protein
VGRAGGGGHLALGVIPRLTSSCCVCVCVYRVKPLYAGITKIKDPKVGGKGVLFCF